MCSLTVRVVKAFFTALLITALYCVVACCWLLMYSGVSDLSAALYITLDSQSVMWVSFFQFLVDNSFCPWLMIFRGRPSTQIVLEVSYHFHNIFSFSGGFSAASFSSFCACVSELSFGPAVGIGILLLWSYISHKLYSLVFSKFFNGRK